MSDGQGEVMRSIADDAREIELSHAESVSLYRELSRAEARAAGRARTVKRLQDSLATIRSGMTYCGQVSDVVCTLGHIPPSRYVYEANEAAHRELNQHAMD
jgi:hypothetical protein